MSNIINGMSSLFEPRSIAFVGATSRSEKWGFYILSRLLHHGYGGKVYPINPSERESILGLKPLPGISSIPESPDLAVIVTPRPTVPDIVRECVKKNIRACLVITAGFAELSRKEEIRLESEIVDTAKTGNMILVGPNSNGIVSTPSNLCLLMSTRLETVQQGSLSITSRSGSVGTTVAALCVNRNFGFSRFVSNGNEADLHIEDYLEFYGEDETTKVILGYTEGIQDGDRFLEITKRVNREKPIIMLMSGVTDAGARAARYHTASSYEGSELLYQKACREAGIIRVQDVEEIFSIGASFIRQPLPKGRRVGILTVGGGWGVIASDTCIRAGLDIIELPDETLKKLDTFLPWWWSRNNPVDTGASFEWRGCLEALVGCHNIDMILVMWVAGKEMTPARELCPVMESLIERYNKPIILCSGGFENREAIEEFGKKQLVTFHSINQAVKALSSLVQYSEYLSSI